jgi:hypothetical protein
MYDDSISPAADWHERAERARAIAQILSTPEAKRIMLQVAEGYTRLARRAERRARRNRPAAHDGEQAA